MEFRMIFRDQEDHRKQPWSHALSVNKLSYCYCTIKNSLGDKGWKNKTNSLGHSKGANEKRKMVQVPQNQKHVGREWEGHPELSTHKGSLFPGGAQLTSEHLSLVLTGDRRRERKRDSTSMEPPSNSHFQPMCIPMPGGSWWWCVLGALVRRGFASRDNIWGKGGTDP